MKCSEVKSILTNDSDAEISANSGLISHVRACKACSRKYGFILNLSAATALKETVRLPLDFESRVWDKIGEPNPSFSFLQNIIRHKWALAAAAAAIILLAAVPHINKGAVSKNAKEMFVKINNNAQGGIKNAEKADLKEPVKFSGGQRENIAADNAVVKQNIEKQEAVPKTGKIQPGNPEYTADHSAPAPLYMAGSSVVPAGKVAAAGVNPVQQELTASYKKGEDEINGDVAVFGNVFHPLQGGAVTIKYRVKNKANVVMMAYDRRGKVMKRIFSGERMPGIYTESWNGTDDSGITAGSGVYVIYLKTDSSENKIKVGIIK
jgi:hypothetical protein